jgi:hypothetical protein
MTPEQRVSLLYLLGGGRWAVLHHGDCVGADTEAHHAARLSGLAVVVHPPVVGTLRARLAGDQIRPPRSYLERNRVIVMSGDLLIAAPLSMSDRTGGTWYTIRYARKNGKPVSVITPDGRVLRGEDVGR